MGYKCIYIEDIYISLLWANKFGITSGGKLCLYSVTCVEANTNKQWTLSTDRKTYKKFKLALKEQNSTGIYIAHVAQK